MQILTNYPFKGMTSPSNRLLSLVPWQNGHAEDCKSFDAGSIPAGTSTLCSASQALRVEGHQQFLCPLAFSRAFSNCIKSRKEFYDRPGKTPI